MKVMKVFRTAEENRAVQLLDEADKPPLEGLLEVVIVSDADKVRLEKVEQEIKAASERIRRHKKDEDNEALTLVWSVCNTMEIARRFNPDCSPITASRVLSGAPFPYSLSDGTLESFFCRCTEAVLDRDNEFFTALSKVIQGRITRKRVGTLIGYLQNAYFTLRQDGTTFPTKKDVRDLALRQNAIQNVLGRPANRRWDLDEKFSAADAKKIQSAVEVLTDKQSWPRLWKAAGLNSLGKDLGGAGQHRQRQKLIERRSRIGKG